MMDRLKGCFSVIGIVAMLILQGCIHEYPYPEKGGNREPGKDPTTVEASLNVSFNLTWESLLHNVVFDVGSRARGDKPHRFVVELMKDGKVIYHEVDYLNNDEFISGRLEHAISLPLEPDYYKLAVWYDRENSEGEYSFDASGLSELIILTKTTTDSENLQCAYASDYLDLSEFTRAGAEKVVKEVELQHCGARFEIVATDVQQFITEQKESLNQGDSFNVEISFAKSRPHGLDLHSRSYIYSEEPLVLSGPMRLPYAEYDELKIAEGFLFCLAEEDVEMKINVRNSSLLSVSRTDPFSVPLKPGFITTVRGDFLTHPLDGIFSVDTIWEGEIVIIVD